MSEQIAGMIPLSEIVYNMLNDLGDYSMNQYKRYMQWAIRKVTDMGLNISNHGIRTAYIQMNDNKTVDLPADYINYVKVGIRLNGQIWTLTRRDEIILPQTVENGAEVLDTANGEGVTINRGVPSNVLYYGDMWRGYYVNSPYYAIGGGYNGAYYTEDKDNRRLVINGSVPRSEVVLQYISSGISTDGDTFVSRGCLEYLLASLHYQRLKWDKTAYQYDKEIARRDLDLEERRLIARENAMTADEFKDVIFSYYRQVKL